MNVDAPVAFNVLTNLPLLRSPSTFIDHLVPLRLYGRRDVVKTPRTPSYIQRARHGCNLPDRRGLSRR